MKTAFQAFALLKEMVENGNPASMTDAGVGVLAIRSCILGAFLNVQVNAAGLKDKVFTKDIIDSGNSIVSETIRKEAEILEILNRRINTSNTGG
jgi:glutamate formiminotransferase/formiminotetrahydrofolate cyclodeaminase